MDAIQDLQRSLQARLEALAKRQPTHATLAEVARLTGMVAGLAIAERMLRPGP